MPSTGSSSAKGRRLERCCRFMSIEACAALVERADPDRFLTVMAAPEADRPKLLPLYAFNIEVSRAPWVTEEPMIAEMRLQWWRDAVEEIAKGGEVRSHEVVDPLCDVARNADLRTALLDQMVAARRWDIYKDAFEDRAHLDEYIDQTSGNLMWCAARTLGAGRALEQPVRDFAYGAGVAGLLRAAAELDARGRKPLLDGTHAGVAALATEALARMTEVRVPKTIAPALWPGWQAQKLLTRAVKEPSLVADGALQLSEFTRRWGLLRRQMLGQI